MDVSGGGEEASQSLTAHAAAGARWTAIGSGVTTVIQLLQLAIVTHFVSPTDFGLLALVMVVLNYGRAFADAGFSQAIIYRQTNSADELASVYTLSVLLGVTLFLAVCAAAPLMAVIYHEPRLTGLTILAGVAFLFTPFGQVFQSVLEQRLRFRTLAMVDMSTATAGAVVTVVGAMYGMGVLAMILGTLAAAGIRGALLHVMGRSVVRLGWRLRLADLKPYATFGGFQLGERMLNLTSVNLDKMIIGGVLGTHALGVYNVAYQVMARPLQVVNPVLTRVAFPLFAKTQHDDARLRRGYLRLIQTAATLGFPIYFGMAAVAGPLFITVFGAQWIEAVGVFRLLCVMGVLWTLSNPVGTLLLAKGRADWGLYFNVAAVATYSVAIVAGARHGINGVVIAMIIASLVILVPLEYWARWRLIRLTATSFIGAFQGPLYASVAMLVVVLGYLSIVPGYSALTQLVSAALIGALVYGGTALLWNRDTVRHLWAATR